MAKEKQTFYVSPKVETEEIVVQAIVCQSGNIIEDLTVRDDDTDNWGNA